MDKLSLALKSKKLRVTQAREEIFHLLSEQTKSMNAREVYKNLAKDSQTDLASVYRNLTVFEELGLIHKFPNGGYAICEHDHEDSHKHHHVHIINHCTQCGGSEEVSNHSDKICRLVRELKSFTSNLTNVQEIVVQGVCSHCSKWQ